MSNFEHMNLPTSPDIKRANDEENAANLTVESHLKRVQSLDITNPETGLKTDYINKYAILHKVIEGVLHTHHNNPEDLVYDLATLNMVAANGMKKYEEWFPKEVYGEVVNEDNKEKVAYINEAADLVNGFVKKEWTPEVFENHREDLVRAVKLMDDVTALIRHEIRKAA